MPTSREEGAERIRTAARGLSTSYKYVNPTGPRVRKDGLCAGCKKPTKPERWQRYAAGVTDPFCSSACARRWYGFSVKGDDDYDPLEHLAAAVGKGTPGWEPRFDGAAPAKTATMDEARRRDAEARVRLGLPPLEAAA